MKSFKKSRRLPKRTLRRFPKRTLRRSPKRTSRRSPKRTSRRLIKGGMDINLIKEICQKRGLNNDLDKEMCVDSIRRLIDRNGEEFINDTEFNYDLDFLINHWKDYITDNFERIMDLSFEDEDEKVELNEFLQENDATYKNVPFEVINNAYQNKITGNWDPVLFVDDEDKIDEWLNELENSKQLGLK
jgi:hypothetical protein